MQPSITSPMKWGQALKLITRINSPSHRAVVGPEAVLLLAILVVAVVAVVAAAAAAKPSEKKIKKRLGIFQSLSLLIHHSS